MESQMRAVSVARGAFTAFRRDNMTSVAAALAYYAFMSVPAGLLVVVGAFGLFAGPHAVSVVVGKLNGIVPAQAASLIDESLHRLVEHRASSLTVLLIGLLVAVWSLTGAMQNVMWGAGIAHGCPDRRDNDRRAVSAGAIVATVLWVIASALFSVYLSQFASYNKAWGSLAAVVIMLTWLWLGGVSILFGAEVDAELERRLGPTGPSSGGGEARAGERASPDPPAIHSLETRGG